VQYDFMMPPQEGGRLYVADLGDPADIGAVAVRPAIEAAVAWMRSNCDVLVYTGDWHDRSDSEIDEESPDPSAGTYPPHCMGRSDDPEERAGAEILDSIRPVDPVVLPLDATDVQGRRVAVQALEQGRAVFVQKNKFDVFIGNPAAEALVEALAAELDGDPLFYVAGVSRDVCVTKVVDGLQERGHETVAIRDATWGLGLEPEEDTLARWRRGGRVLTLDELRSEPEALGAPATGPG
jgi:nicotinamidase-related amidase